ncbi:MAG: decaprenyl-phosphate phosphoribosyltransferase [Bacteroidales bacterium]|nr:decaprenyl-phosphate phosphoribosyltransferase [Bacteroidales bacterium]MCM1146912.1 decaprenyl-phosphate phosphoribosyltransferase [Bacteroidales bacterium]MCM1205590.1 decaprenyl-phosphate phosphoribosyltransferase [Bacillota bacterium]MCM1510299.1 decaprenyl-phosphate phosphoribosyltransferase [Clostridium sp.]
MKSLILLTRPHQWIKNTFIFMPMFFGGALTDMNSLTSTVIAFLAYSFAASSIYCYNDIIDVEDDRRHSVKCKRPIASGRITTGQGYAVMLLMFSLSMAMIYTLGDRATDLGCVIAAYYILDIAYCRILKHYAIVDVCVLSFGFVLRILAGSAATGIAASHWLVLMTFLLTLLLGFAKRRDDVLRMMKTGEAPRHNTQRYNLPFINQAVTITAAVTVVCYIMYTISPELAARTNSGYIYLTTIFVLLGLLRYIQLAEVDDATGDPTKLLYKDRFLQTVIGLWVLSYVIILYGRNIMP